MILPNATNATYSLPATPLSSAGQYRVIITNSVNAVTSILATLTVYADASAPHLVAAIGNNLSPAR